MNSLVVPVKYSSLFYSGNKKLLFSREGIEFTSTIAYNCKGEKKIKFYFVNRSACSYCALVIRYRHQLDYYEKKYNVHIPAEHKGIFYLGILENMASDEDVILNNSSIMQLLDREGKIKYYFEGIVQKVYFGI